MKTPDRIARLDKDRRGYPIPFNVLRGDDGTPHFTINDDRTANTSPKTRRLNEREAS